MTLRMLAPLLLLVTALGCAHQYVPEEYVIVEGRIAPFEARGTVHAGPAPDPVREMRVDVGVHNWTFTNEIVAQALADQLLAEVAKGGGQLSSPGDKMLEISIKSFSVMQAAWTFNGVLGFSVTLGNGREIDFSVPNNSPGNVWRALNGTLARSVVAILENPEVRKYLAK